MKREFELEKSVEGNLVISDDRVIIGPVGGNAKSTYVVICGTTISPHFIKDEDLETFAVNILKAIKSKHLK